MPMPIPDPRPTMPRKRQPAANPGHHRDAPIDPDTIGGRIRAARAALGMSQGMLGDACAPPMSQSYVSEVETSGDAVMPEAVARIASALGIDPCDLDTRLLPSSSITLARVAVPGKGVGWEPLHRADRARIGKIWAGDGPASESVGELADRAAEDGIAVVLRGDLPVKGE